MVKVRTVALYAEAERPGLVQCGQRTADEGPNCSFQYLWGGHQGNRSRLFTMTCGSRMRENRNKLKEVSFRLDVKNTFFTMRTVEQWSRLLRKDVQFCPWKFSRHNKSYLVWPQSWLSLQQEDELETWDTFLPELFYSLMILILYLKLLNSWFNQHEGTLESQSLESGSLALS